MHLPHHEARRRWTHVMGPGNVLYLKSAVHPQRFYLFGDVHQYSARCSDSASAIDVDRYIEFMIKQTAPDVVDVFLEAGRHWPPLEDAGVQPQPYGYLFDHTLRRFAACRQAHRRLCPLPTARVHWSDVRTLYSSLVVLSALLIPQERQDPQPRLTAGEAHLLVSQLEALPVPLHDVDAWLRVLGIQKQIDRASSATIKHALNRIVDGELRPLAMPVSRVASLATQRRTMPASMRRAIAVQLLNFTSHLTDLYILARALRGGRHAPMRSIVYAGVFHTHALATWLVRYLQYDIETLSGGWMRVVPRDRDDDVKDHVKDWTHSDSEDHQCVDITPFQRPFFL
jgi:hypothetical protein